MAFNVRDDQLYTSVLQFDPRPAPSLNTGFGYSNGAMWYDNTFNTFYGIVNGVATAIGSTASGVVKANTISATDFGVKANTQWATDASFTNTSGAVVLSATDPPFASTDVGKACWGTNYTGGTGNYAANTLIMGQGTITSVTDSRHATCSATAGTTTTGTFVWGTDDTAALTAAWNAAANNSSNVCKTLILPSGGMITTTGQFNSATCLTNIVVGGDKPMQIMGQGMRVTYLVISPNFSFNHSTSCNGTGGSVFSTCFFGVNGLSYRDLSISGMGWDNTGGSSVANTAIAYLPTDGYAQNVDLHQFAASDGNVVGYSAANGGSIAWNINSNGGGSTGLIMGSAGTVTTYGSYFCCNLNSVFAMTSNAQYVDFGSGFQGGGCGAPMVSITNGIAEFYRSGFAPSCSTGNTFGVGTSAGTVIAFFGGGSFISASGGVGVDLSGDMYASEYRGGASGTARALGTNSGSRFFDLGGNAINGGAGNFINGAVYGSPSVTGTAQTSGNWSVPAGSSAGQWGTSPSVGTCTGDGRNQQCTITVGSGTPGANPVAAITFPASLGPGTGFWTTPICSAKMVGGTATLANFTNGTISATSAAFTYQGTPAASSTVVLVVNCSQ